MPKALPGCKLSQVRPSADELAEARKTISALSQNAKDSKRQCMKNFLKNHPDVEAASAKGEQKERLLEMFHIYQSRCKASEKKQQTTRSITTQRKLLHTLRWMSEEAMDKELGAKKAEHWRTSQLLPQRPDRVTKSWDKFFVEFGCPEDIEQYSEAELKQMKHQVETELQEDDPTYMPTLMGLNGFGAPSVESATAENVTTKAATEKTPSEIIAQKIDSLRASCTSTLAKYQSLVTSAMVIKTKAESKSSTEKEYARSFIDDLGKHIKNGEKLCADLTRMLTEATSDTEVTNVIQLMEDIDAKHASVEDWAVRFGCEEAGGKSRRSKRQRKN